MDGREHSVHFVQSIYAAVREETNMDGQDSQDCLFSSYPSCLSMFILLAADSADETQNTSLIRPLLGLALRVMRLARAIGARGLCPRNPLRGFSPIRFADGRPPLLLRPDATWVLSFDPRSFVSICGSNENLSACFRALCVKSPDRFLLRAQLQPPRVAAHGPGFDARVRYRH